jgi:hypothetical protein
MLLHANVTKPIKDGAESRGKTLILMLSSVRMFELYFLGKETMKKVETL